MELHNSVIEHAFCDWVNTFEVYTLMQVHTLDNCGHDKKEKKKKRKKICTFIAPLMAKKRLERQCQTQSGGNGDVDLCGIRGNCRGAAWAHF